MTASAPDAPHAQTFHSPALRDGFEHHRAGRLEQAERCYRAVLAEAPQDAEALHHLALVRHQQGRGTEALGLLRQALALDESQPRYHFNLATILTAQGRPLDAALSRAVAWLKAGRPRRAVNQLQPLAEGRPGDVRPYVLLGEAYEALGQHAEAAAAYRHAGGIGPAVPMAWLGLARLAIHEHRYDEARQWLEQCLQLDSGHVNAWLLRAQIAVYQGRHPEAVHAYRQALQLNPSLSAARAALVYCLHFLDEEQPRQMRRESEEWSGQHTTDVQRYRTWPNDPDPERVLRVGIVSTDFRAHPDGQFLLGLLRHRDPDRLHVTCYSEVPKPDFLTRELHQHADGWVRVHGWSDAAIAERVRADEIDALLDATGYQAHNRLRMHAHKPVPLQVAKVGYLCTRGLREFDAIFLDPLMMPPDAQQDYVETPHAIPDGHFLYFPPPRFDVPVAEPPALQAGHVTFGSFNNASKLTPRCIALFARVLSAVPDSAIYLRAPHLADTATCDRLRDAFAAHGIAPERLRFGGGSDKPTYLADFASVDIHLDTVPNNGVTTTCDSLWMGVPVVALWGREGRSRIGATLVTRAGHPEWAADDEDAYVHIVADLAADPARLAAIRSRLRGELEASPICDGPGHARAMEAALRELWREWCAARTHSPQQEDPV